MKKRTIGKFHKFSIVAMVLTMAVVFSSCSKSATTTSSPATNGTTAPTHAEVVTLQGFADGGQFSGTFQGWWADILKEKVGVQFEMIPTGDQAGLKLQALMAGGELPDIVRFFSQKQFVDAVDAGLLVNLDEHMDKLPNVAKYAQAGLKYYRDAFSNGTGNAYLVPSFIGPYPLGNDLNNSPYIRWDLYKQLGMPVLEKFEDYLPLLKKMQDLEPKNKDGQKVYGFSLWKDWDTTSMRLANYSVNGINTGDPAILPFVGENIATGELTSIFAPGSEYLRFLKFYYTANQMGLLDPDSLTQNFANATEKLKNGRVLFSPWAWWAANFNTPEHANANPPIGLQPVFTKENKIRITTDNSLGDPYPYGISKSTKNLEAALKFLDFIYSLEGNQLLYNGPKGVLWDVDAEGQAAITDAGWDIIDNKKDMPGGGKLSDASSLFNSAALTGAVIDPSTHQTISYQYWDTTLNRQPSNLLKDWQSITGYKSAVEMVKAEDLFVTVNPAEKLVPPLTNDLEALKTRIGDVVKTNSWLAIFAKNDAEFQEYIDDMVKKSNEIGLQKIIDATNENWKIARELEKNYTK
ncbi:extracellular solute-binding protein [Paenibacillus eucommiae]|uniref:Aldouronate transport system substrate-binding protein n=1 Tax=Paenibacillus eucommiae TaxID=1355755 RepID=A0ABS4ITU8_9BACL|nr:extracellular solute-binding protein [Paenibacillus eucommiae]MBP1990535.1 putative aldouronate transport system substrate-binding protein [Paenibacillus eucommiae]